MQFNSVIFLLFITFFFILWPWMKKRSYSRWIFLTVMSLIFYGWWDWRFIFLILFSGSLDFVCGNLMIRKPEQKKLWLLLSVIGNIGSLGFFKYTYFLIDQLNGLFGLVHLNFEVSEPSFTIILPVGISFYTFQSLSYTIDIYKGNLRPTKSFLHFMSYLTMFPQLVAGPIIRAKDLLRQLSYDRKVSKIARYNGLKLIGYGLFQKAVIADNLGYMVDRVFQQKTIHDGTPLMWIAIIAFSFQIYYDFSGYSLIARGLAKMMGYHYKMNFNHPYLSIGFKDFWSRWHISLSTWFRDYVYIPLGGSRQGKYLAIFFMGITMVVSGIWHGANLTFVVWGLLHAFYLAIERLISPINRMPPFLKWSYTYLLVLFAWIFFRAESIDQGFEFFGKMFAMQMDFSFINEFFDAEIFLILAISIELYILGKRHFRSIRQLTASPTLELIKVPLAFAFAIFFRGPDAGFIYFQF